MWTCPHCSHSNPATAAACSGCAAPRVVVDRTISGDGTQVDSLRPSSPRPSVASISGDRTVVDAPTPSSDLMRPGLRVGGDGRYELIAKLGEGGMGSVWRAKDLKLAREVAIKRIRGAISPALQERFQRETRALTGLSHPNVVTVFDAGEDTYGNYLVMELVSGKTLAQRLREGPLDPSQAVEHFCAMCRGMSHAHKRGVVHRDLKPSNVMLNEDGVARILDFGLVRLEGSGELSMTGVGMGTLDYASPEQKQDGGAADERSDVFSLGMVFYEMLTGRRPAPLQVHKVKQPWRDVIAKATEPDPHERHASMDELLAETESARAAVSHEAVISQAMGSDDDLRCPECRLVNTLEARFCRSCSRSLQMACPACDAPIRTGLRRCDKCGADVRMMDTIRKGIAAALPLMADGDFEEAEQVLRPLLRETLDGPVGGGERHVQEVERLLARCRADDAEQEDARGRRSSGRRRGSRRSSVHAASNQRRWMAAAVGFVLVVIVALLARGGGGRSRSPIVVASSDPRSSRDVSSARSSSADLDASQKPNLPVHRDPSPVRANGAPKIAQAAPSAAPQGTDEGDDRPLTSPPVKQPEHQQVELADPLTSPAEDSRSAERPIPVVPEQIVAEWVSGVSEASRRESLLAALEAIVFAGHRHAWVDAMRQSMLSGSAVGFDAATVEALEAYFQESGGSGSAPLKQLLPWLELVSVDPRSSALIRWATLKAWIELDSSRSPIRIGELADSLAASCAAMQKDAQAKRELARVVKLEPLLQKALGGEVEVARFLAWSLPRLQGSVRPGREQGPKWLERELSAYAQFVYDQYFDPRGSGKKADVLLGAAIWMAIDEKDQVARLVWALAKGSTPLEDGKSFSEAVAKVKELAPWFAAIQRQPASGAVRERMHKLGLLQACQDAGIDLGDLQSTYVTKKEDDVGMIFPDHDVIAKKLASCAKAAKDAEQDYERNMQSAKLNERAATRITFEQKAEAALKLRDKHLYRERLWEAAQRRLR